MSYLLGYEVAAATRMEAIAKAVALLRTDVRLNGVSSAEETAPGWWKVRLHVWEDV